MNEMWSDKASLEFNSVPRITQLIENDGTTHLFRVLLYATNTGLYMNTFACYIVDPVYTVTDETLRLASQLAGANLTTSVFAVSWVCTNRLYLYRLLY
jgi:hypothetical protein